MGDSPIKKLADAASEAVKVNTNSDGTIDGVGALAAVAGLSRDSVRQAFALIQENTAKLNACDYHYFEPVDPSDIRTKYVCLRCKGEIDHSAYHWHEQGRRKQPPVS